MAFPGRPREHDKKADEIAWAIQNGETEKAKKLILKTNTEILNGEAKTPIFFAVLFNRIELVEWLIKNNAMVNIQDRKGFSPLHIAAEKGFFSIIKLLIENEADTNVIDDFGNGPLWTACHFATLKIATDENFKVVDFLLKHKADPYHKNNYDRSPMTIVSRSKKLKEIFEENGFK